MSTEPTQDKNQDDTRLTPRECIWCSTDYNQEESDATDVKSFCCMFCEEEANEDFDDIFAISDNDNESETGEAGLTEGSSTSDEGELEEEVEDEDENPDLGDVHVEPTEPID